MNSVLQKFSISSPKKYYSEEAYKTYSDFLSASLLNNRLELLKFLSDKEEAINISYKLLENINNKPIHECEVKSTDAVFIDEYINYNYLQLLDGALLIYIQLAAYIQLIDDGKQANILDLYNCVEKLSTGKFSYLKSIYEHNVRNGIGHGKIVYWESKAEYFDKKDNKSTLYYYDFIRKFDLLLDIVNGFTLAYINFWNKELRTLNLDLPRQILFEEIKLHSTSPAWEVVSVINQQVLEKRQLAINIHSWCSSQAELRDEAVKTAIHAARLAVNKFDIIYLHITHNDFPGYVKFDVERLNIIDYANARREDYASTVTDSLEWFFNGFSETMPASMDSNAFDTSKKNNAKTDIEESIGVFTYKDISQHVNVHNDFILIKDARYTYSGVDSDKKQVCSEIKLALPSLLAHARKKSKELTARTNHRQLPIKYLCISIYEQDKRARTLRSNGIKPNLICTIQYNVTNTTGNIKLMDSRVENFKDVFFNWNHYWRNAEEYERVFPA